MTIEEIRNKYLVDKSMNGVEWNDIRDQVESELGDRYLEKMKRNMEES